MSLSLVDPLAHRALDALMAAEAKVMRELKPELQMRGISTTGFAMLVLLTVAGGSCAMRTARLRLRVSKATASEAVSTLEARGLVTRQRIPENRRAAMLAITGPGRALVDELFPQHTGKVKQAFSRLDEDEKRSLTALCRKLAA